MFIIGGKGAEVNDNMRLDVYDTESSQWTSLDSLQRYRHIAWQFAGNIFLHGGFGNVNHNLPVVEIYKIDLFRSFQPFQTLSQKIVISVEAQNPTANAHQSGIGTPHTPPSTSQNPSPSLTPRSGTPTHTGGGGSVLTTSYMNPNPQTSTHANSMLDDKSIKVNIKTRKQELKIGRAHV